MTKQRKTWCFRPKFYSTFGFLLLALVFAGLTYWQCQRAFEKEAIVARHKDAVSSPITVIQNQNANALHLKKVEVICTPDIERQFLLDNQVHKKRAGYLVLLPCQISPAQTVLLSRGWVIAPPLRVNLPDVHVEISPGAQHFLGDFAKPGVGLRLADTAAAHESGWPRRIQYLDFDTIGDLLSDGRLSSRVLSGIFHLDVQDPLVLDYYWQPVAFGPERHYGYAFQWFALLLTLIVLYIVLNTSQND